MKYRILATLIAVIEINLALAQAGVNKYDLITNNAAGSMLLSSEMLSIKTGLSSDDFKYHNSSVALGFRLFHKSVNFNLFANRCSDFARIDGVNPGYDGSFFKINSKYYTLGFNYAHQIKINELSRLLLGLSPRLQKGDITSLYKYDEIQAFTVLNEILKLYVNAGAIFQYRDLSLGISYTKSTISNVDFMLMYVSKLSGNLKMVGSVYSNSRNHFRTIARVYMLNGMLYYKDFLFGATADYIKYKNINSDKEESSTFISPVLGYRVNRVIDLQCAFSVLTISSNYLSRTLELQARLLF